MFGKDKEKKTLPVPVSGGTLNVVDVQYPTTIAEGIIVKDGKLVGVSSVKISGIFFGDVEVEGVLVVTGSGRLTGHVKADDLYVYGTVEGNANIKGKVHIYPAGSLTGDVNAASFCADEGSSFAGQNKITANMQTGGGTLTERNAPILEPIEDTVG
jgi:cytoskeletal protein CcmA (bactofilin family)